MTVSQVILHFVLEQSIQCSLEDVLFEALDSILNVWCLAAPQEAENFVEAALAEPQQRTPNRFARLEDPIHPSLRSPLPAPDAALHVRRSWDCNNVITK